MRAVRLVVVACLLSGTSCQVTPNGDPAAKGSCAVVEDPPGVFTMTCPNGGSATWSEGTEGTAGAPGTDGAIGEAGTPGAPRSPGAPDAFRAIDSPGDPFDVDGDE